MNIFTFSWVKHLTAEFKLNFWLSGFIMMLTQLPVLAQDFTNIVWGTATNQPTPTTEVHGEVVNNKLYIFGGYDASKQPTWTPTKKAFVYNPVTNLWGPIADLPHTPSGSTFGGITHVGTATDGIDIYFAGGYTSNSNGTGQLFGTSQAWKYNVSSNTYTRLPDLPQALAAGQLRYLNGKIHYMGGTNLSRVDVGVHYALNLANLSAGWTVLASLSNPRNHPGSAVYEDKIYFMGGAHNQDNATVTQNTVEVYNPTTNTWTRVANMPVGRDHISSSVVVIGSRIIVLGGESSHNVKSKLVSAYSPLTNSWTELTPLPNYKSAGVAAVLNGNIHYTGGNFSRTNYKGIPAGGTQTTTTLLPVADAFVRNAGFAGTNYGNDISLIVKTSASIGYTRSSYLKFSLGSVNNISSAKLRIYGLNTENTSTINISSFGVDNDAWTESGLTFNNAPAASTSAISSVGVNNVAKYYEVDVTSYVKTQFASDKIVSLLIKDPTTQNKNLTFNSKENANNKPQLVIVSTSGLSNSITENILISEKELTTPVVYPNPIKKTFTIKFPEHCEGEFSPDIVDQSGRIYNLRKIFISHEGGSEIDVDISKLLLPAGVYFLRIKSITKTDKIKLIIQ